MADSEPVEGYDPKQLDQDAEAVEAAVAAALVTAAGVVAAQVAASAAGSVSAAEADAVRSVWNRLVTTKLTPAVADVIRRTADHIRSGITDAARRLFGPGPVDLTPDILDDADIPMPPITVIHDTTAIDILSQASNRMRGIGDDLWLNIRQALVDGLAQGESIPELAARVRGATAVTEPRARTVARTETIGASNGAAMAQARSAGIPMSKTWLATPDLRTRPAHIAADGQTVPLDEPFQVGEPVPYPLDFPGDPTGPPELTINCRCTPIFSLLRVPLAPTVAASAPHLFTCRDPLHYGPCAKPKPGGLPSLKPRAPHAPSVAPRKRAAKKADSFSEILGADSSVQKEKIRTLDDSQLMDLFAAASSKDNLDEPLIIMLGDEFDSRDKRAKQPVDVREQAKAEGDVYRRPGETRQQAVRRSYEEHVHMQLIQAEQATRGHLLNPSGRNAHIDPMSLFSGPAARARKWASEDLLRFWQDNPRVTFDDFKTRASVAGRKKAATRGNGRDFGV